MADVDAASAQHHTAHKRMAANVFTPVRMPWAELSLAHSFESQQQCLD